MQCGEFARALDVSVGDDDGKPLGRHPADQPLGMQYKGWESPAMGLCLNFFPSLFAWPVLTFSIALAKLSTSCD